MTAIPFDDSVLTEHFFLQWKLTKVKLLLIFNMNFGIPVTSIKSTLWLIIKFSFCNCIATRKCSVMSFSFTFSSLYEAIQSFWIKTSISSACVFCVEECAHFVHLGDAGCVGTRLGLTQLVNTEVGFKGLAFHKRI